FAKLINDMRNIKMTMSRMQLNSKFVKNMLPEWAGYGGVQNRVGNANPGQARQDLALNMDNVFQADDCDAFDYDVDEAPMAQTMFMANLSYTDPVNDEAGPSYDSDIIYEYVKDNTVPVVHSNVSPVPNDAYMMIYNDMYQPHAQSAFKTSRNTIVENSLTAKLATYKEQVELYERRARFELTEREQKINEQLRLVISNRNFKKETPALYNGHEIIKDNHVPTIVHNIADTLEIAEITRRKMNDKMKDPECVNHKVQIAPHDYLKENFLATFTPHKQLTPGQIFWSQDLIKMKSEALKEQTIASRPIKALTVKHDEIKQKNLLIANDNLIVECLSKEVFFVATNSELNVARFIEMDVANTIIEARCLELKAELSNLRDKSHNKNHDELVNRFPIFRAVASQITQLTEKVIVLQEQNDLFGAENDKIKQHYKELYDSIKIIRAKHIEQVMALTTENVNLKAQILDTVNSVSKDHVKPKVLAPGKCAIDVEPIVPLSRNNREAHLDYLRHLKESVETIHDIVEEAKVIRPLDSSIVSAFRYTKHSQELLEYANGTCP
nr:hypothetical protein [Tanacetum cinerariifolium]